MARDGAALVTPSFDTKQLGAIDILAGVIASSSDPLSIGVAASIESHGDHGVRADVRMPNGSEYRITVEWIGDRESSG